MADTPVVSATAAVTPVSPTPNAPPVTYTVAPWVRVVLPLAYATLAAVAHTGVLPPAIEMPLQMVLTILAGAMMHLGMKVGDSK